MQVSKISIRNILGVEALEFQPGAVTRVTGGNAVGKTSVLEALKAVARGGHDVTILRNGQEKGEVAIEFDDGLEVSMSVTPNGTYRKVKRNGEPLSKPAEVLRSLWDSLAANPIDFVNAKPKQRVDWLLEGVDPAPVYQQLRARFEEYSDGIADLGAMEALTHVEQSIREERTEVNREAKHCAATVQTLSQDLPPEGESVQAELEKIQAQMEASNGNLLVMLRELSAERDRAIERATKDNAAAQEQIDQEIADLERRLATVKQESQDRAAAYRDQVQQLKAGTERRAMDLEWEQNAKLEPLKAEKAKLEQQQVASIAAADRRKTIAQLTDQGAAAAARSEQLTAKLEQLDQLKGQVLAALPLQGLEIRDGDIFVDGVPFDRLNEARKWSIAIGVARDRAGEVGIVCADGFEALDDTNFEAFVNMAKLSGLNFIVTDRGNGALEVDTEGRRTAA